MLSVLSGALLMVASSLTGIAIKRIFKVRYSYFSDVVDFLNLYKREISSLQTPLDDVIKTFLSSSKGAFSDSLQKYYSGLFSGYKNVEEVQRTIRNVTIKEKDSLDVAAFLYSLGKSNLENEITNTVRYLDVFNEKKNKFAIELNKKGEMYYKLFVVLGVTLMLIVV